MAEKDEQREAVDRLNESNQILVEARMLPTNKPLSAQQNFEVISRLQGYLQERNITLAQVAREVDYSESVLSQWQNSNYKGNVDAVTRRVNTWMERDARRAQVARPKDTVSTWVAETMRSVALQADKRCMMAAIVSPAGTGKTKVLKAISDEMRGLYVYCTEALTEREFLAELWTKLTNKKTPPGTKAATLRAVVACLAGTKRIILLDEAQQLSRAIQVVRAVHDQAQVPIVMAGTADILRYVDDRTDGRGQFSSRTIRCNLMDFVSNAEDPDGTTSGRDLFTIEEIQAFFAMRKIRLADDAMRLMWALACLPNFGTLRLVGTVADVAADVNIGAECLTRKQLLAALQLVVGGEAKYLSGLASKQEERSGRRAMVA